jgi:hypothetical protein
MVILGKETSELERKAQAQVDNLQNKVMAFEKQKQKMVLL